MTNNVAPTSSREAILTNKDERIRTSSLSINYYLFYHIRFFLSTDKKEKSTPARN